MDDVRQMGRNMWAKHIAGRKFLTMPFPAAWKDGLLRENYAGLARSEVLTCQAMIEQLLTTATPWSGSPRARTRASAIGSGSTAATPTPVWSLIFIITADGGPNEILGR